MSVHERTPEVHLYTSSSAVHGDLVGGGPGTLYFPFLISKEFLTPFPSHCKPHDKASLHPREWALTEGRATATDTCPVPSGERR